MAYLIRYKNSPNGKRNYALPSFETIDEAKDYGKKLINEKTCLSLTMKNMGINLSDYKIVEINNVRTI